MRVGDIYDYLNQISPFELQEKWDNSGLIVGSFDDKVKKIVLSIDIDQELLDESDENVLFIVHHPLIFSGVKQLNFATYPSNLLRIMIKKNQSLIAMHTNFDQTHLNRYVLQEVLGLSIEAVEGFIAYAKVDESFETLSTKVQDAFSLSVLKTVPTTKRVKRLALCTGSGASLLAEVEADCFLTGDIKYHDAMSAKSLNMGLIEIGHYESEHYFATILEKELTELEISVIISSSKNPFVYKS